MTQPSLKQVTARPAHQDEEGQGKKLLAPLLCRAVVFADPGPSIYYTPGILYGNVHNLSGFFVLLTMSVFVLLTLKHVEVTHRFPQVAVLSLWQRRP